MEKPKKLFDFESDDVESLMSLPVSEGEDVLFKSVKELPCWNKRCLDITNSVICYWTGRSIAWAGRNEIGAVRSLIRRIKVIQPEESQPRGLNVKYYYEQWKGVVSVLEARVHILDCNDLERIQREKL